MSLTEGLSMSDHKMVRIVVEGPTEEKFIKQIVAPHLLLSKGVQAIPVVLHGNVSFDRVRKDVINSLKGNVEAVSYFVDYYGLKDWPEKNSIQMNSTPQQIADTLNNAAKRAICEEAGDELDPVKRFIPFMAVHEFEALLFSDSAILAKELGIEQTVVDEVLSQFNGNPENINSSPETAPSKRLESWKENYKKTVDGIAIADKIGLPAMRAKCPLFNAWLSAIEAL